MSDNKDQTFAYPLAAHGRVPWGLGIWRRMWLSVKYRLKGYDRSRMDQAKIRLVSSHGLRPLGSQDMPIVFLVHNERRLLPAFLEHYREMGVTRFLCVDDRSNDGSREFLLQQPDVDLYESEVRYSDALRGRAWREKLFDIYGYDRWYLNVDSDEFFIYESHGTESVLQYSRRLQESNIRRVPAVMLDMYPVGPLDQAELDSNRETMPWEVATHFDGDGYVGRMHGRGFQFRGGVRQRLFQVEAELGKYPLIYWSRGSNFGKTIHRPLPPQDSFPEVMGCLLHFKIFADFLEQVEDTIANGQHWNGAMVYRNIQEKLQQTDALQFHYDQSIPYRGAQDLIERGFILPMAA